MGDEEDVDGGCFEDVDPEMGDVEVEDWEEGDGEEHVEDEKEAVGVFSDSGKRGGADDKEGCDCA